MANENEEFLAKVCTGGRITIPLPYRERLSLATGDRVRVNLSKDL